MIVAFTGHRPDKLGGYAAWKMQKRNQFMVDHSNLLIAVWDGSSGGTSNCVAYAKKIGLQIVLFNPKDRTVT